MVADKQDDDDDDDGGGGGSSSSSTVIVVVVVRCRIYYRHVFIETFTCPNRLRSFVHDHTSRHLIRLDRYEDHLASILVVII